MLLLLDIDGVMVPANSWKRPEFLKDGFPAFSSKSTQALQKIIFETSADILLITSHRSRYTIEEWQNIFKLRGIITNKIDILPESKGFLSRKEEVMNWFSTNNNIKDFIVIDDDKSLNALPPAVKRRLIQTSASVGLTNELAIETLHIVQETQLV